MATSDDNGVLCGMVASVFGVPVDQVVPQDTFEKLMKTKETLYGFVDVTLDKVHELSFVWGDKPEPITPVSNLSVSKLPTSSTAASRVGQLFVKTFTGRTVTCYGDFGDTVKTLKQQVEKAERLPVHQQRMIFAGKSLEDDHLLLDCGLKAEYTVHVSVSCIGGGGGMVVIKNDFLDPQYNYDFTDLKPDTVQFMRGNEKYERPIGRKRIAINVTSKYRNDLSWLGPNGARKSAAPDEWPVCYHGMIKDYANDIAGQGLQLARCKGFAFGKGIYSTPSLEVAELYAKEFEYKGSKMKVIFQNRINPKTLVKISKEKTGGIGEYWISPKDSDIRPYGICIKKAK